MEQKTPWMIRNVRALTLLCTLAVIAFIFSNSMQVASDSSAKSGTLLEWANNFLSIFGLTMTEHVLRKLAHLAEFALLGLCLLGTVCAFTPHVLRNLTVPLFLGLLIPVLDETIQLFVAGRSSEVKDVLIDFSGVLIGIACGLVLLFCIGAFGVARTDSG